MDRFIAGLPAMPDADLMLCQAGIAYQADMAVRVAYDEAYFSKCLSYEDQDIAIAINAGRIGLVNKYVGAYTGVLDIGVGSGEFIKKRPNTFGYDINPEAVAWLKRTMRWSDGFAAFDAFTFWDVLEHVPVPEDYFRRIHEGAFVFTSLPVFDDLAHIRKSRHYRPGEHLYYFTQHGFVRWMGMHGFSLLERADFETAAGRDSILSFAFVRHARPMW
jgi:SAM-dependent methyltransferase